MIRDMTDGEKERIKLSATYLNGIAIAFVAVGAFALSWQWMALAAGTGVPFWPAFAKMAMIAIICLAGSAIIHSLALKILRRLD